MGRRPLSVPLLERRGQVAHVRWFPLERKNTCKALMLGSGGSAGRRENAGKRPQGNYLAKWQFVSSKDGAFLWSRLPF